MGLAVIELVKSRLLLDPYRWSQRYNAAFNGPKKICSLRPMHEAAAAAKPTCLQRPGFLRKVPNVMRNSLAATGYCIAIGEAIIGTLLVLGLWVRPALTSGSLLMILLLAGTSLLQNWSVAGLQLGYLAFYAAVLATATCDRFSIDGVLRSRAG